MQEAVNTFGQEIYFRERLNYVIGKADTILRVHAHVFDKQGIDYAIRNRDKFFPHEGILAVRFSPDGNKMQLRYLQTPQMGGVHDYFMVEYDSKESTITHFEGAFPRSRRQKGELLTIEEIRQASAGILDSILQPNGSTSFRTDGRLYIGQRGRPGSLTNWKWSERGK